MTIEDDIILPFIIGISAILLTIGHQTLVPRSSVDYWISENDILFTELSDANHEISILSRRLDEYHTTKETLISLGASHTQAVAIIKASEVYNLDPKY